MNSSESDGGPAGHLALDEAMLLAAEDEQDGCSEAIRLWHFDRPVVVLGRSSRVGDEVDRDYCDAHEIPLLRRCSGGASVVGGPGCLMYSVVLSLEAKPQLQKIDAAHRYVMERVMQAMRRQVADAALQGICDLTWQNRKCSGNSLRVARRHLLYHGTILHDFDLDLLDRCLTGAPRQPAYRNGRGHGSFVTNVTIDVTQFSTDLCQAFGAAETISAGAFSARIDQLRRQRYDQAAWTHRH